MKKAIVREK